MSFAFHQFSARALTGQLNWTTGVYSALLIEEAWTPDPAMVFVSDIDVAYRPRPSTYLTARAVVDGAVDCDDIIFPRVPVDGNVYQGIVVFQDSAVAESSRLLVFHDDAPEWPVTPNGGNVIVTPDSGADRLFRIGEYPC